MSWKTKLTLTNAAFAITHHLSKSHWIASILTSHHRCLIKEYAFHKFSCPRFLKRTICCFFAFNVVIGRKKKNTREKKCKFHSIKKRKHEDKIIENICVKLITTIKFSPFSKCRKFTYLVTVKILKIR